MKKLVSILLSILILSSVIIAVPTLASGAAYVKGTVIKVVFTADDVDKPFTGLEGSLTFGKDLTLDEQSVSFPNVSNMQSAVYEGKIVFNASNLSNYDISSDKVMLSAEFTVNNDISEVPVSAELEDIYYREGAVLVNIVTVPYKLQADVSVVYDPEAETGPASPDETVPDTGVVVETTENISGPVNTNTTEDITEPYTGATESVPATGNTDATEVAPTGESAPSTGDVTEPGSVDPISTDITQPWNPTGSTDIPIGTGENPTSPNPTVEPITVAPTQPPAGATDPSEAAKTSITLSKTSASLYVKGTTKINANVKNRKGAVSYKSNKTKIAKVDKNGKVTALKKGTAVITVSNNGAKKLFTVKVKNPKLNKKKVKLKKGKSFKLKVIGKIGKAKFKSSKKKIVTVSKSGKLKAKKKGKATITVKTNGKIKLKCKVTVK